MATASKKVLTLAAFLLVHDAGGWTYPMQCCGDQDCHRVPCEELLERGDGKWQWGTFLFQGAQIHPSEDRYCHVCTMDESSLCAFIQQGA